MALDPKKKMSLAEKLAMIDKISEKVNTAAGKKLMGRIGKDPEIMEKLTVKFIPSKCEDLNTAVGGGYPRSRCTIISGLEDSGKTSIVLQDIGFNQQRDQNFTALWIESEKSLEKKFCCETFKIDPERFIFIEYDPNKGAEGILDILYDILKAVPIDMVCINSLKCLTPLAIIQGEHSNMTPGIAARLNSKFASKFTALVADNETAMILITHTYAGIGSYGAPQVISGGRAIRYWAALIMNFTRSNITASDPIGEDEGVHIKVSIKKNHCIPADYPYKKFEYYALFGEGVDQVLSYIEPFQCTGLLEINKGTYSIFNPDGELVEKIRGKEKYRQYMKEHKDIFEALKDRVKAGTVQTMTDEEVVEAKKEDLADQAAVGDN